ncbi:hypothetical protein [Nocardioides montaniterrae]
MSLVNTETGEILDASAAERRAERINLRLDAIADNYAAVMPMIREALEKRDDLALGYRSPGEYVADRFGGSLQRLGVEVRREVVRELTAAGMSTRAIAPVVGASFKTVARDLESAPVSGDTPEDPAPSEGEAEARGQEQAQPEPTAVEPAPTCERPEPLRPVPAPIATVTGIDGKRYTRPTPVPKPERSGEQQNAEENSRTLASSLIFLLAFQHPNQRDTARDQWEIGQQAVPPTNRGYVTPDRMRQVAEGLAALADEWESIHE